MVRAFQTIAVPIAAALLVTGCTHDGYYDRGYRSASADHGYYARDYRSGNGYRGSHRYAERYDNGFRGRGAQKLDPWLSETREGQQFVADHYPVGQRGEISSGDADSANIFFRRWADTDRDYRLTDAEIRTALVHTRNRYGRIAF
ncbi:hypothetical protein HFP57_03210 [Parasphingopyxis algicola]|uniref:hypothetical protein n=1 Tax=Parasphingopyxis algicola TaxID=2026624 RepID=UPI0015A34547|nr:hypothetical protein [Parasphingopyxis algicola]QLC24133.1 hypothetical protein HFP57_03210 [Parasphingopyxis algicola]